MKKPYFPAYHLGCNPIHEVRDWAKVRRLIRAARRGKYIPPILIDGEPGNCNLLAGTHRAAANDLMVMLSCEPLIEVAQLDDLEDGELRRKIVIAAESSDYEEIDRLWDRRQL